MITSQIANLLTAKSEKFFSSTQEQIKKVSYFI